MLWEFIAGLARNPITDETSSWRSKRWLGVLGTVAGMVLNHNGWLPQPSEVQGLLDGALASWQQISELLFMVGVLDASNSPRKF